jgi:Coenzyme F390 synthetase
MKVSLERLPGATDESAALAKNVADEIRRQILVRGEVEILPPGTLPRSFSKTKRVVDDRDKE